MPRDTRQTPAERALQASAAAHASWANTSDRLARTAAARAASSHRFESQVDPDQSLPPEERRKRAESAKSAHMAKMAAASAKARRLHQQASTIEAEMAAEDPELITGAEQLAREAGGLA